MFKLTGDVDFISDLEKEITDAAEQAVSDTIGKLESKMREKAGRNLSSGSFDRWDKGFSVDEVANNTYVITLEGSIANIIDKGWKAGEISDNIMKGPRATYNKAQGKDYVDVPIGVEKPAFLDADGLMSQFKKQSYRFSNSGQPGKPATRVESRETRRLNKKAQNQVEDRLKNIIESRKSLATPSKYLVIKRVNNNTQWPKSPIPGAGTFEDNPVNDIGSYFEEFLEKIL